MDGRRNERSDLIESEGSSFSDSSEVASESTTDNESPHAPRRSNQAAEHPSSNRTTRSSSNSTVPKEPPSTEVRIARLYDDQYRQLLNGVIDGITGNSYDPDRHTGQLRASQLGLTWWTADQKERFFDAIALKGKDDLPYIASHVDKSESEVRSYISLLDDAVRQTKLAPDLDERVDLSEITPAAELSQALCNFLDGQAEALSGLQLKWEDAEERKKYGDSWLLGEEVVRQIKNSGAGLVAESIRPDSPDYEEGSPQNEHTATAERLLAAVPEVHLLKLETLLELSDRLFMKDKDAVALREADPSNEVSIRHTALADLHQLAINVTRRLAYTAHFQALCRIRAKTRSKHKPEALITQRDVRTATQLLGFNSNSWEYWATLPRRLGVRCSYPVKGSSVNSVQDVLKTRHAQDYLRQRSEVNYSRFRDSQFASRTPSADAIESSSTSQTDSEADTEPEISTQSTSDDALNSTTPSPATRNQEQSEGKVASSQRHKRGNSTHSEHSEHEDETEAHIEVFDAGHSIREEDALRQKFGLPTLIDERDHEDLSRGSKSRLQHQNEGSQLDLNWRSTIDYAPEWQSRLHARARLQGRASKRRKYSANAKATT